MMVSTTRKLFVGMVIILFFCGTIVQGAVPGQTTVQGVLINSDGDPVSDGEYQMTFAVYDVPAGGDPLWSETQTVDIVDGIYNVILGQPGNEIDPTYMDGDRYLGVQVTGDDEMTPRQPIAAAVFAIRAGDADTLEGKTIDQILGSTSGDGLRLSAADDGVHVDSAGENGVRVYAAGADGVGVYRAGSPGFNGIISPENNGVEVNSAEGHGLYVGRVGRNGVNVSEANSIGVKVSRAGSSGVWVDTSGDPLRSGGFSGFPAGFEVTSVGGDGLYVGHADRNGVCVAHTTGDGVLVEEAATDGIRVNQAGNPSMTGEPSQGKNGFEVNSAEHYGLHVGHADRSGVVVNSTGASGIAVNYPGEHGVYVYSAGNDGVHVLEAGNPSRNVSSSDFHNGFEVNSAEGHGLYVGHADHDGVHVNSADGYAGWFGGKVEVTDTARVSGAIWPSSGAGLELGYNGNLNRAYVQAYDRDASQYKDLQVGANSVGIGTGSLPSSFKLTVNGTAAKPGGGSWSTFSDARLKDVIAEYEYGLDEIMSIRPVIYRYKEDNDLQIASDSEYVGVIAQEIEEIIPEAVEENASGHLMVNGDSINYAMLNAIKMLKAEVNVLKKRIDELEKHKNDYGE